MSTDLLTYAEAGRHIGITERSIRNYVRRGFLTARTKAGSRSKYVAAAEVEELRLLRNEQAGRPVSRQEIMLLSAKVAKLEYTVQTLLMLLDAKTAPLGISAEYAAELYQTVLAQLKRSKWSEDEITPWADIFLRIAEDDFTLLKQVSADPRPWSPFLRLCAAMTTSIVADPAYNSSLVLQDLHRTLAEARRRLRAAAVIFEGQHNTHGALRVVENATTVVDALDSVLGIKK